MTQLAVGGRARAAVLVEPGRYELRDYPIPDPPAGGALVAIRLAGICGTDKHTYQGDLGQYTALAEVPPVRLPLIQGHENVGHVLALGGPLRDFEDRALHDGDRVVVAPQLTCDTCWACRHGLPTALCQRTRDYGNTLSAAEPPHLLGGWAEVLVVLPRSNLFLVPDELPDELAVLAESMAVTVGLDRARSAGRFPAEAFGFDDAVLVYGVGPLGLCHVLKARMLGAGTVIAVDRSATRLAMALRLGADIAINVDETSEAERLHVVRNATGGRGADVVVEAAGVPDVVPLAIDLLRPGGTFLAVGNFADLGEVSISPNRHLVSKGIHLIGVAGEEPAAYLPALRQLVRYRERYPVDELVAERFPLGSARAAVERSIRPDSLKVIFDPRLEDPSGSDS